MTYDELYDLAFQYKKTKLWKTLWDDNLIAIKMSGGETAYLCVMGMLGEEIALGVYVGDEAFQSLRVTARANDFNYRDDPLHYQEMLLQQSCLQCAFENKDLLEENQQKMVREYARAHGIRLRGANSYPQLLKYTANHLPYLPDEEKDLRYLGEALRAAVWLSEQLEHAAPAELGIRSISLTEDVKRQRMPLLIPEKDGYRLDSVPVPAEIQPVFPHPAVSEETIAPVKRARKSGVAECRLVLFPASVNGPWKSPAYPFLLLTVRRRDGNILPVEPVVEPEKEPEGLLEKLTKAFVTEKYFPNYIFAADERTYALLEDYARAGGMKIRRESNLPELREAEQALFQEFGFAGRDDDVEDAPDPEDEEQEIREMIRFIMELPDAALKEMPDEVRHSLEVLMQMKVLPEEFQRKWRRVFGDEAGLPAPDGEDEDHPAEKGGKDTRRKKNGSGADEEGKVVNLSEIRKRNKR